MSRFQLKSINWEWTREDDEDSLHEGSAPYFSQEEELTTAESFMLIDDLALLNCEAICIQGGPPFFRKDWESLAQRIIDRGMKLALISSGSGIRENLLKLKDYFNGVAITLDGPAGIHDMIKQRSGSFDRAVESLVSLNEAGVYTGVVTTISNHNIDEMESISAIVGEIGPRDWLIRTTLSSGAMKRPGYESYTIPPADVVLLIKHIADFRVKHKLPVNASCDIGYFVEEEHIRPAGNPWAGCTGGIWTMGVEANGNVKMCLSLPDAFLEGNVRDLPLRSLWNDPELFPFNRSFNPESMFGFCRVCEHSYSCACGCIASAYASTDSRYDNFYCFERVAKEFKFIDEHPGGGKAAMDPKIRSRLAKEDLYRILEELAKDKKKPSDN